MRTTTANDDQNSNIREKKLTNSASDSIVEVHPTGKGGRKFLLKGTRDNIYITSTGPMTIYVTNILKRPATLEGAALSKRAKLVEYAKDSALENTVSPNRR